jgi:ketosteroid isomerase-like protein
MESETAAGNRTDHLGASADAAALLSAPGSDAGKPDSARAEVMTVLARRLDAMRAKDIDRAMSVYSPDIVYFDIIPPHQFVGADAVRRNFLRWFAEYQGDIGLETHDLSVVVSGDVAFAHMLHPDSGTRRSGQDVTVVVRSTVCLQRRNGQWLITHEHISFPINPDDWSAVVDAAP